MTVTPAELARIRANLPPDKRRELDIHLSAVKMKPDFLGCLFPEQRAFVEDPSPLKGALCTRRSGKSFADGIELFKSAYENPGVSCLYVGLTRDSAKRIMWKDVYERINDRLRLEARPNLTELTWTLPNRAIIYTIGIDSSEKEKRKVFGQKFKKVKIDEAALYSIDLRELIYGVLQPACTDLGGTISLTGMPSNLKRGMFFELTERQDPTTEGRWIATDKEYGATWSFHRWGALRNPHVRDQWALDIAKMKAVNPLIEDTPLFQQEYLGRWTIDDTKLVYRYLTGRNDFDGELPEYPDGRWHYVLAVDLGFKDPTSFTVWAYHDNDPNSYVMESSSKSGLDFTDVSDRAKELDRKYAALSPSGKDGFDAWIVDGAVAQGVEEMRRRHSVPWVIAEKQGKNDHIELMNADMIQGLVKANPDTCEQLIKEWSELIWDNRGETRVELAACPNHCADGGLYGWRKLYAYRSTRYVAPPRHGTAEWYKAEESKRIAKLESHYRQQASGDDYD